MSFAMWLPHHQDTWTTQIVTLRPNQDTSSFGCTLPRQRPTWNRATSVSSVELSHVSSQRGNDRVSSQRGIEPRHLPACTAPRGSRFHDEIRDDAH
jgi:hypothetical protein